MFGVCGRTASNCTLKPRWSRGWQAAVALLLATTLEMLRPRAQMNMTTLDERRRNLIWGRETLMELSQDTAVPSALRARAEAVLSKYPELSRLHGCDDAGLETLQDEFIQVLYEAKLLFMQLRTHPSSDQQRRYSLRVVLRHFV